MSMLINTCSACGAEEGLDALLLRMIDDDTVRGLIAEVITNSLPLGGLLIRYLRLHKPPSQKLRMSVVGKLLAELVPDIQRSAIERSGRTWLVSGDSWKAALQAVFDAKDKGTVTVPLQGNGYLYQVLMRIADRGEAAQEKQVDQERRNRTSEAPTGDPYQREVGHVLPPIPPAPVLPDRPKLDNPMVRKMKADIAAAKAARS